MECTDTDGYYGAGNTVDEIGPDNPSYQITAWTKIISLPGGAATGESQSSALEAGRGDDNHPHPP